MLQVLFISLHRDHSLKLFPKRLQREHLSVVTNGENKLVDLLHYIERSSIFISDEEKMFHSVLLLIHSGHLYIQMSENRNVKMRVNALIHRLQINKAIKFQTRIQWKRHQNKVETQLVNHEHGYSVFEQAVFLDLNLTYNESKGLYDDKNTEIVAIIMYEGKVKSGGYAKYNISQVLNNNLDGKMLTIPLSQCPDPNANVEITFSCESLDQANSEAPSILNASSRDLNMSRVDFHDDKISLEMQRINSTISKLGDLARTIKEKEKPGSKIPELMRTIQDLQGEKAALQFSMNKLEEKLLGKEKEFSKEREKDRKGIAELEQQLERKAKDFKSRQFIEIDEEKRYKEELSKKEKQIQKYRELYEQAASELEQHKSKNMRGSMGFAKMEVDDVHEIAKFENEKEDERSKELQALRAETNDLQIKVATESFRIAQLFNAAYDIGGPKLLDELQKSIGLIEM